MDDPQVAMWGMIGIFIAFLLFGFAMVPLMLKFYVMLLKKSGVAALAERVQDTDPFPLRINRAMARLLQQRFWLVVVLVWAFYALGLLIALPAMIQDGFFTPVP
jgi:hypothetical protein